MERGLVCGNLCPVRVHVGAIAPELGVVAPDPPLAPGAEDGSEHAIRLPGASLGPERLRGEGYPSFTALQAEHQID